MADQFDLEQGIMECWNVTGDLDVLFEELVENQHFTTDQASNFVLGLSTIYESKFNKLFRTFEDFLAQWYKMDRELKRVNAELSDLREEMEAAEEANDWINAEVVPGQTLQEIFEEMEEERLAALEAEDTIDLDLVEDEFGFR